MTIEDKKDKPESTSKSFDDVLKRMLSTPPPKQEPKKQQKKTGK
jgi:hypothetical protein